MTEERRVFDPGLQPERTALAWRRTALSLLVGSVVGARLLAAQWGWLALAVGALGTVAAAVLWVAGARRARSTSVLLLRDGDLSGDSGALLHLTAAAASLAAGLLALVLAVAGGF